METSTVAVQLNSREREIIHALRDIPVSPLRELMDRVLVELLEFVREPKCAEMQADGVPCATASADCEQCEKLKAVLVGLTGHLTAT